MTKNENNLDMEKEIYLTAVEEDAEEDERYVVDNIPEDVWLNPMTICIFIVRMYFTLKI